MAHPKNELIERTQSLDLGQPEFLTENSGPAHRPHFQSRVRVQGQIVGEGEGKTKRTAEKRAAEVALQALEQGELPETHDQERFEGPWPIFPEVLAASLRVAHERSGKSVERAAIRDYALELYKELLQDLGDIVEVDAS